MARNIIKDEREAFDQKLAEIQQMANSYVIYGFQKGVLTHSQVKGNRRKKAGQQMADIAIDNEFGWKNIPARPFVRPAFDENREMISEAVDSEYRKVLAGRSTVKKSLGLLGQLGVGLIQRKIRSVTQPPNSPVTIAIKKSSKPLIDFGQMIQSVTYKVVIP